MFRAYGNRVFVDLSDSQPHLTKGGIHLPEDTAIELQPIGKVVSVGQGVRTAGQIGARDRTIGDDGAVTANGHRSTIALIWRTEKDFLVCPRCAPLEGKPEEVWSLVFPEGPGEEAHPNCRCELEVRVVAAPEDEA